MDYTLLLYKEEPWENVIVGAAKEDEYAVFSSGLEPQIREYHKVLIRNQNNTSTHNV